MLFRSIRLLGPGELALHDVLRTTWPTAAEPPSFAPPIDAREDEDAFTVSFDVTGVETAGLVIEVVERTVYVVEGRLRSAPTTAALVLRRREPPASGAAGRRRGSLRAFALGAAVDPSSLESDLANDILTIRIAKAAGVARKSIVVRSKR